MGKYNATAEMHRVCASLLVIIALWSTACASEAPSESTKERVWRQVGAWSGHGSQQLDTFPIERLTWRLRWETKNETTPGAGTVHVTANSGDSGREVFEVLDVKGVGRDIEYFTELPRRYYFVVTSNGIDWSLIAEEPVE